MSKEAEVGEPTIEGYIDTCELLTRAVDLDLDFNVEYRPYLWETPAWQVYLWKRWPYSHFNHEELSVPCGIGIAPNLNEALMKAFADMESRKDTIDKQWQDIVDSHKDAIQ